METQNADCIDCEYGACAEHDSHVASQPTGRVWAKQQTDIFDFFRDGRGNMVTVALAGTGKTTTIIEAVKFVSRDQKILLAAFNTRIKEELAQRSTLPNVEVKSLHGLGFAFIRNARKGQKVVVDKYGDVDKERARAAAGKDAPDTIVTMVRQLAGYLKNIQPFTYEIQDVIDLAEKFDCTPSEDDERDGWTLDRVCRAAGRARDAAMDLDPAGRISFDDMIYIPIACGYARPWFNMVVVDEAQDMNFSQLLLAQQACKRTGRIVVVGDPNQAIYGFRGADSNSIARLTRELNAKVLGLTTTYRCGKAIVDVARQWVPDFTAGPNNPQGIIDACTFEGIVEQAKPGDFVLSRKNAPLMPLCLAFLKRGVRARIEGKDVGEQLRNIVLSFKADSVPRFIERVQGWQVKVAKRAKKIKNEDVRAAKLEEIADMAEMLTALAAGCNSVAEILTRTDSLFGDAKDNPTPSVVLSSVHKAKGLEADRVFLLAETFSTRNVEEQNIYYVAVTRAKKQLTFAKRAV